MNQHGYFFLHSKIDASVLECSTKQPGFYLLKNIAVVSQCSLLGNTCSLKGYIKTYFLIVKLVKSNPNVFNNWVKSCPILPAAFVQ